MPYARRSRYAGRSRRYRRYRSRTLSTRSVYTRTGAKAQAGQILALRRRVSRISRRIRPDIKVFQSGVTSITFTNSALSNTSGGKWFIGGLGQGTNDSQRVADKIYVKNLQWTSVFEYSNDFDSTTVPLEAIGGTVRVVILQARTGEQYDVAPNPASLITNYTNAGVGYNLNTVSPLVNGITKTWNVLRDFRFKLDENNPIRQFRMNIPIKYRTIRYAGNTAAGDSLATTTPDHGVFIFVCASGLHYDSDHTEQIMMTQAVKMAYTDD